MAGLRFWRREDRAGDAVPVDGEQRELVPLSGINDPNTPLYQALVNLAGGGGGAGLPDLPSVNIDTSVRMTAVYRAVSVIAVIAGLPLDVYTHEGGRRVNLELPEDRYIWSRPNPEHTRVEFWKTCLAHNALAGNTYIFRVFDRLGRTAEVWPIHPSRVHVGRDPETQQKIYVIDGDWDRPLLDAGADPRGEITHVTNLSLNGLTGVGPIQAARLAWQVGRAAEEMAGRMFSSDATPGGILTTDAELAPEDAKLLRQRWESYHRGYQKAKRVAVLDRGAKYQQITMSAEDAQWLESRRFQVQEIARMFGIPPHLLADSSNSTSWGSGLEEQGRAMVVYTLSDYSSRFEAAIRDEWLRGQRYARWNYAALLRGNTMQRYQAYSMAVNQWMTVNEIRALEDLPPIEGGDVMRPRASDVTGVPGQPPPPAPTEG